MSDMGNELIRACHGHRPTMKVGPAMIGFILIVSAVMSVGAQDVDPNLLLKPTPDSWPTYHGDYSGQHHSALKAITPANVKQLTLAWAFQTGQTQQIKATPGTYVTIERQWKSGDTIEIAMPLSFRAERTIDDPSVQSIFYGPTLLAVQAGPVGDTLETGLILVSLYKHFKLSGDFSAGMTPVAGKPLHFTFNGQALAPFFVADPNPGPTSQYHVYVRRQEPSVVFGSVDSGVANTKRDDGLTFLDAVWAGAPFADHGQFVAAVERVAAEWRNAGGLSAIDASAIVQAARRAQGVL